MLHKAVIVHDVNQARAALAAGRPVTLLSAPNAAMFGGCLWWRALLREADFAGLSLLDCGDAPGRALEAIRLGLPGVILTASDAYAAVAIIAAEAGAVMLRQAPPALDLGQRQAERELMAWLG
jgi:hypothetical protein